MQPNAAAMGGSIRRRNRLTVVPNASMELPARTGASAIEVEPIADAQQPDRAQADGGDQHDPLEQRLPQRFDVEHEKQVADRANHQRSENGPDGAARAAEQRYAAQHYRRNRIQGVRAAIG